MPETSRSDSIEMPACNIETPVNNSTLGLGNEKTRKRKRNMDQWKTVTAKRAKNSGTVGVSTKETPICAKVMGIGCVNCRFKCQNKISFAQRKKLFEEFWSMKDHTRQWEYIARSTPCPQNTNLETISNKECSKKGLNQCHFFLNTPMGRVQVCREMFLQTFSKKEYQFHYYSTYFDNQNF